MINSPRKLEAAANISVICAALLVGGIALKQFLLPKSGPNLSQIKVGQKVSLKNIDWSLKRKHVVLGLSSTCRFCADSAPFYQRLIREVNKHQDLGAIAILQEPTKNGAEYLGKLGVSIADVRQTEFASIPISATPTILLVTSNGVVEKVWVGKLSRKAESEVMEAVGCKQPCG